MFIDYNVEKRIQVLCFFTLTVAFSIIGCLFSSHHFM